MNKTIHRWIQREYEKKQQYSEDVLRQKEFRLQKELPEVFDIEKKIRLIGVRISKATLHGESETLGELALEIAKWKEARDVLLYQNGYSSGFLEREYECKRCQDTGYIQQGVGSKWCSCYRQQMISFAYSHSNLNMLDKENFNTFQENYYTEKVDESRYGIKLSPRDNIRHVIKRCQEFVQTFDEKGGKNLFFTGPTGVGKTFTSNCIAKEVLDKEKTVLYLSAPRLFEMVGEYRVRNFQDEGEEGRIDALIDVDLLIIDDLGIENRTMARYAELLNVLNSRSLKNQEKSTRTMISTNLDIGEIYKYYSERVASRIIGEFELLKFVGDDIRMLKR